MLQMQKRKKINRKVKRGIQYLLKFIALASLIVIIFIKDPFQMTHQDKIIYKISQLFLILTIISPLWILLSDNLKSKLPLFKRKTWWSNIFGFLIVFLIFGLLSCITSSFQSDEFKDNYQSYLETKKNRLEKESLSLEEQELSDKLKELTEENETVSVYHEIEKNLKVHYLDVGQGDSIFLELPNKETILIDAAEATEANKIKGYIQNLGYQKIDYVIATHPHSDHIGGLSEIIKQFDIGSIYMPKAVSTSKTYENLLTTIAEKNLKVKQAKAGIEIINQNDLKIEILSPKESSYANLNNYSIVLKLTYKKNSFLFMGDAEKQIEEEIQSDVKANVIKIGHHGSNTSSSEAFVEKVKPQYAIISVGKDNKYNHPYSEILDRWSKMGAEIYRTDEDGSVIIESDGENLAVSSANGKNNNVTIMKANTETSKKSSEEKN